MRRGRVAPPRRASDAAETIDGLDLRLLAFVVLRELAEQQVGDDEAEHRVAEELERLVVDDAAAGVLVRARPVRQRVLEQAAIAEAVADAPLRAARARRAERHHLARSALVAMAVDDALRVRGILGVHRDPTRQLVDRQRERRARHADAIMVAIAVRVEQTADDARPRSAEGVRKMTIRSGMGSNGVCRRS